MKQSEQAGKTNAGPLDILIAEDSESNQVLLSLYFGNTDCNLVFAANGEEAVKRFKGGSFDLVLMDIFMPVMDGLAATAAIREFERDQGLAPTPIVAVSANAFAEDRKRSLEVGCTDFLAKPIRKGPLLDFIDRIVEEKIKP
ncbi:MAG: response regulator [Pseudodesulfovibrio sp.]|uniref:response regulator n=1 Tax=Pseudodesulfovibrio sp. TaxID=2035812 RepID=UPI003D0A7728